MTSVKTVQKTIQKGDTVYNFWMQQGGKTGTGFDYDNYEKFVIYLNPTIRDINSLKIGSVITLPMSFRTEHIHLIILGHTDHSLLVHPAGIGEISNCEKIKTLSESLGVRSDVIDIYELFGGAKTGQENLATACKSYWWGNITKIVGDDSIYHSALKKIKEKYHDSNTVMFLFSWSWNLGGFIGSGIHNLYPTISRWHSTHVGHIDERYVKTYNETSIVCCISTLGVIEAIKYGIPSWKVFLYQHNYPSYVDDAIKFTEQEKTALKFQMIRSFSNQNKELNEDTVLIGMVGRLMRGKNAEYTINAVRKIVQKNPNVYLWVKGILDDSRGDQSLLKSLLEEVQHEHWFLWDKKKTPLSDIFKFYNACDIHVQMTGSESASNVCIELTGLGKPLVLLEESVMPYLYKDMVIFVKPASVVQDQFARYAIPDEEDLYKKLEKLVHNKSEREKIGKRSRELAIKRFSSDIVAKKTLLMIKAALAYKNGSLQEKAFYQRIMNDEIVHDMKLFGLHVPKLTSSILIPELTEDQLVSHVQQLRQEIESPTISSQKELQGTGVVSILSQLRNKDTNVNAIIISLSEMKQRPDVGSILSMVKKRSKKK